MAIVEQREPRAVARWSVGGAFVESLADRDFERMASTMAAGVQLRAMLPRGPLELEGAQTVADQFATWFGTADDFEVVDASIGEVCGRLHLSWRLRLRPAPGDRGPGWHVIEQQAYADASGCIEAIDLLCSGFHAEQ
jgi:hypothetical protein